MTIFRVSSARPTRRHGGVRVAWMVVLLLPCLLLGMGRPAATLAVSNGRIVFASERTGNWDLFTMDPDGSHVVNLTNSPTDEERAGFSPDGQQLAFARAVGGNTDIYLMNADGSNVKRLTTHSAIDHAPQWSPDGTKIAFRSDRDGNSNVYVMNADGSNQTGLTTNPANDNGPDWAPDGQHIVFSSDRAGNDDVYVMNADGSNQTQVTTDPAEDFGASWSPDGTRIVFRSGRNGTSEVYIMQVNGQGQTNLTNNPAFDRGPAWSPDGSRIVFYSNRDGDYEIYTMKVDGSDVKRLTNTPGRDFGPDWGAGEGDPTPTCYPLTRSHSGSGNNPVATPASSTGCGAGQYVAGEAISLAAAPSAGWRVAGWGGTNNDGSTSTTNTVTMPAANHTVSVTYEQIPITCYTLTRTHSGSGNNPVADPALSQGCGTGQYVAGESIALSATPAAGWRVAGWDGTNNDASTSTTNTVVMPAAAYTVSVVYEQVIAGCYTLTRGHSGQGSDPTAAPASSTSCGAGQYVAGESITLTATPAAGWRVAGWGGTNNDASTNTTNTVTMPAANHTVSVTYEQIPITCYTLTRSHSGQGSDPTATPNKSTGCGAGQYVAGEAISLTAAPSAGWRVAGWGGTNNDGSTSTTNTVTMPAVNHSVSVIYDQQPIVCYALTRTHSGSGGNPVADPALSPGCGTGQYVAGESIALTASPTAGWQVAGWDGTNDDAGTGTANTVTMPAANHTVSVSYEQAPITCYVLTRSHSGQGSDPTATPNKSTGCGAGQYVAGEVISLTAGPANGWRVAGWDGTNNDSSTNLDNSITMPAAPHTITVVYAEPPATYRAVIPMILHVAEP